MGENENRPIVAAFVDGKWQSFGYLDELRDIDNGPDGPRPDEPGPPGPPGEYRGVDLSSLNDATSVTIYGRLELLRMSRKRFIKLLMSRGISRNDAAVVAERARENGWTYVDAWWAILLYNMK